ncbi:MAG: DUF2812 domain-containing protein [Ruminococcaceae bacterium]|nr:DUF2812 domain-containing protein [Oscillospiraceae bacterium]
MSNTKTIKRRVRFFSPVDWEKEEEYLRKQHSEGWKFVRYTGSHYVFEKCEPEDVVYQLDFKGDEKDMDEYIQMFKDCGWEYLQDMYGYSYFRKPAAEMKENEEGIFCDNESRLEMLKNIYRRRISPLFVIFFMIIIPQLVTQTLQARLHAEEGGDLYLFPKLLSIVFAIMFVLYLAIFIKFGIGLWKFKKSIGK